MNLSESTVSILKNFNSINPSLLVRPGNQITTMSPQRSIIAKATVAEDFPQQFAIYELSKFLGVLSLFKDPEIDFGQKSMKIQTGKHATTYTYADANMIVAPPEKEITFPGADIEFSITTEDLQKVVRATGILQVPDIVVSGYNGTIEITATNSKNPTTDVYSIEVGETTNTFLMVFKAENIIKLIPKDYNVRISSKGISQFNTEGLMYFVANEANSNFGG